MANTGRLIYQNLEEYFKDTGVATGNEKPNDPNDPDYIPPEEDLVACPIDSIEPEEPELYPIDLVSVDTGSVSSEEEACLSFNENLTGEYFMDSSDFSTAEKLYVDSDTLAISPRYYTDGNISRFFDDTSETLGMPIPCN